jgi:transposase
MFNWFVQIRVLPHLRPGSVLVLDNASVHRDPSLVTIVEAAGFELLYLPPYSPDLNPIEQTFNVLKAWIRRHMDEAPLFSDFGAFLAYAVEQGIGDVEGHYLASGYRQEAAI